MNTQPKQSIKKLLPEKPYQSTPYRVDVVIISYNTANITLGCLASLHSLSEYAYLDIILVDNGSTDSTIEQCKILYPNVRCVELGENKGYSYAVNKGVETSTNEFLLVINSDTIFSSGSIEILTQHLIQNASVAVCGPQQIFPNGMWQRSYGYVVGIKEALFLLFGGYFLQRIISRNRRILSDEKSRSVEYIDGAVMCIRRKVFEEFGGFDERYFFFGEDADFCYRVSKHNYGVHFVPSSVVVHYRGASRTATLEQHKQSSRLLANAKLQFLVYHRNIIEQYLYALISSVNSITIIVLYFLLKNIINRNNDEYSSKLQAAICSLHCFVQFLVNKAYHQRTK